MCCCARATEGNRKWASHCDQLTESVGEALWSGSFLTTHALSAIHRLHEHWNLPWHPASGSLSPLSLNGLRGFKPPMLISREWIIRADSESFVLEFCTVWVFNVDLNLIELLQNQTKTTHDAVSIAVSLAVTHYTFSSDVLL